MRIFLLCFLFSFSAFAQNLLEERIWKISSRKKSIFLDSGVFHHSSLIKSAGITSIRSSLANGQGYERVVIDFNTQSIPKIYGHISQKDQKVSIDFFDSSISTTQPQLSKSKNVKMIDFIKVDEKSITMNLLMNGKANFDIFYLENPGRLVIDIR